MSVIDDGSRYVFRLRDGDYIEKVLAGGCDSNPLRFEFTKNRKEAAVFTKQEMRTTFPKVVAAFTGPQLILVGSEEDIVTRRVTKTRNYVRDEENPLL